MSSSSLRAGWGILPLICVGCFVDAVGLPPEGSGNGPGGGTTTTGFTGGGGEGASGAGVSMGGGGSDTGGSGGTLPARCGDGTAVTGEDCEDGNLTPGDGCDASCHFEMMCGNNTIDPTEECDPQRDNCTSMCKAEAGTGCAAAISHQDPLTDETVSTVAAANPFLIPPSSGEFVESCDTSADVAIPTNVYRIQIGPYPEGIFLKAKRSGNTNPVLSVYKGCGDSPTAGLFCNHADSAMVVTNVVPAGSVMFATVGDRGGGGDFEFSLWFHRFWATFDTSTDWLLDPGTWFQGTSELLVSNVSDADGSAMISPPIFVGNLNSFEVVLHYGFEKSSMSASVSFDGGTSWQPEVPLAGAPYDPQKWARKSFDNPMLAQSARVRISYVTADPGGRARVSALRVQPVAPFNTW
jgi:cysteine-rich repeat protein